MLCLFRIPHSVTCPSYPERSRFAGFKANTVPEFGFINWVDNVNWPP